MIIESQGFIRMYVNQVDYDYILNTIVIIV